MAKYTRRRIADRTGIGRAAQASQKIGDIVYHFDEEKRQRKEHRIAEKQEALFLRKFSWE